MLMAAWPWVYVLGIASQDHWLWECTSFMFSLLFAVYPLYLCSEGSGERAACRGRRVCVEAADLSPSCSSPRECHPCLDSEHVPRACTVGWCPSSPCDDWGWGMLCSPWQQMMLLGDSRGIKDWKGCPVVFLPPPLPLRFSPSKYV